MRKPQHPETRVTQPFSDAAINELVLDTDPYLSCDDCFDQVDEVIEAFLSGEATVSEAFRVHLRGCQACYEEALSLADLIAPDYGVNPDTAKLELKKLVRG